MLLRFKVKNYKSFVEESVLSMMAGSIKEHKDSLINCNGIEILPLGAIFGANGSGKSNYIKSLKVMVDLINDYRIIGNQRTLKDYSSPFIFENKTQNKPTEFELSVCDSENNREYRYGFVFDKEKILEEWLFVKKVSKTKGLKEKCIYYREWDKKKLESDISEEEKKEIEFVNSFTLENELVMTNLGKRGISKYSYVYYWCNKRSWFIDYSNAIMENYEIFKHPLALLYDNNELLNDVSSIINLIDPSIKTIKIKKELDSEMNEKYVPYSTHNMDNGDSIDLPFSSESCGTKKMLSLSLYLLLSLKTGVTLFIDELDSKFHPLILRYIIKMFSNNEINVSNGQLIFTSHNLVCLDSSDLRRDEIWFVEKLHQRSQIFSLYDFKEEVIRSDLSFGKNYLSGRFGAIPFNGD